MRILLTNDDGIHAEGLVSLEKIARALSDDVWVVAPESDQSGLAHSLTLSNPLRLREIEEKRFSVRGTPTDCVIMAMRKILPGKPDLVLSGVNVGGNMADDVTYSGTVAGAMEGTMLGVRSIALSQEYAAEHGMKKIPWATAETHGARIVTKLMKANVAPGVFLNVNFPACQPDDVKDVVVTTQGQLAHRVSIEEREDGRGFPYYWLCFQRGLDEVAVESDVEAIRSNNISVTPLHLDLTAYAARDQVAEALKD